MKKYICILASAALLVACEQKTETVTPAASPAETENNTTVVNPTKQIAAGNFDGKPGNEVVACGVDGKLHALKGTDGSELWASPVLTLCFMPAIAAVTRINVFKLILRRPGFPSTPEVLG